MRGLVGMVATPENGISRHGRNIMVPTPKLRAFDTECKGGKEVMGIKVKGMTMSIFNVYNKPSNNLSNSLLTLPRAFDNVVICGDFNAHHPTWGSSLANTSGKNLISFLDNCDHVLLNLSVPTHFIACDLLQWYLLDLTIVSSDIACNCTSNFTHDFLGSDHSVILSSINNFTTPTKLHIPKCEV